MIEFSGELCFDCKNYIYKKTIKILFLSVFSIMTALSVLLIVAAIIWDNFWHISIILIAIIVICGLSIFLKEKKAIGLKIPTRIIIKNEFIYVEREHFYNYSGTTEDNKSIYASGAAYSPGIKMPNGSPVKRAINIDVTAKSNTAEDIIADGKNRDSRHVSHIKKIVDMGKWYQIIFYGQKSAYYACQKDLIVNGTMEEFERLFESKIIPR